MIEIQHAPVEVIVTSPSGTNVTITPSIAEIQISQQGPQGPGVPQGGSSGQVLTKSTSADYATQWTLASALKTVMGDDINATPGAVLFGGSDGVLDEDPNNFYWDDSTKSLGIGPSSIRFFPTESQKLSVSASVTAVGQSVSDPFDVLKVISAFSASVDPSTDTNSGIGATLYASFGGRLEALGDKNFNGGLPLGSLQRPISLIGSFGALELSNEGNVDGAAGVLLTATHGGRGANVSLLVGAYFDAGSQDVTEIGNPTGTLDEVVSGLFTSGCSGVGATKVSSGQFVEPISYDAGSGAPIPTIQNKTAVDINGTLTRRWSAIATATSITALPLPTSARYFTGSTVTTVHGIEADSFEKEVVFHNPTSVNVTFQQQSSSAIAKNRIASSTFVLVPGASCIFSKITFLDRWVLISKS